MTLLEALTWGETSIKSSQSLNTQGHHNAKIDAQILLSFVLGVSLSYLFTHFSEEMPKEKIPTYQRFVERRRQREPIAYILGKKAFYGRDFFVNPHVLIPRPETEMLIDIVKEISLLHPLVLDIGTGSGAIGITIERETKLPVIASDVSDASLKVAKQNAKNLGTKDVSFVSGSLFEPFSKHPSVQKAPALIILANLPYIPAKDWETLDDDVRIYEPKHALVAGVDGLDLYDDLLQQLAKYIEEYPRPFVLLFEIDPSQKELLPKQIQTIFPQAQIQVIQDLQQFPRFIQTKITP